MATTILKSKNINALKKEKRLKQTNKQKKKKRKIERSIWINE
jgi:hypothetical protein